MTIEIENWNRELKFKMKLKIKFELKIKNKMCLPYKESFVKD